jgi:RNA polymerase sigma-70 factor (sigma-E family)
VNDADLGDFTAFVVKMRPRLQRTAYLLCGDWHLADDLTQETIMAVYRRWDRLTRDSDMSGYCYRVLANTARREQRRAWRRREIHHDIPEVAVFDQTAVEIREVLLRALARLGPRQRLIIVLRYYEDMSVEQIAAIARCSPGTVRSQSSRALTTLRKLVGPIMYPHASTDDGQERHARRCDSPPASGHCRR